MPERESPEPARAHAPPPRVLLLAPPGSYRIVPYVKAAARLGCVPVVASTGKHALVHGPGGGLALDFSDPHAALEALFAGSGPAGFAAVVATDDLTVELACRVAAHLGLPTNDPSAARLTRRKDLARARLAEAGLPVPPHRVIDLREALANQLAGLVFPAVVKPLAMSGSRGVIRVDGQAELRVALARVARIVAGAPFTDERHAVLVEGYLPGDEVALEGLLVDGRLEVLALFDKPDPLSGPFFEETYYVTPSRHPRELQQQAARRVAEACAAYGLRHGPVHAELRLHAGEAWVLEVAARTIGGQCARLLQFGTGRALEELVIARALDRPLEYARGEGAAGVLMLPVAKGGILRRVEGVLEASRVDHVEAVEISVREGYELVPLPEGDSYLGFIFARAPTPELAEQALRRAHACLDVVVAPILHSGRGAALFRDGAEHVLA